MLESGYIKIYRSIVNWEWYSDANTTRLFLHLLLTVNYEPQKWRGITVNRGQRVASYGILAKELKLSVQNIRTAIKRLISTGEITHTATSEYGLFTVNNYDKFQTLTLQATDEQHTANSRPTHDQQLCNKDNKAKKANKAINTTLSPASGETREGGDTESDSLNASPTTKKKREKQQPEKPIKTRYAEFVSMTNDEYSSLVAKIGEQGVKRCIEILDNYKGASGKKYASDYRAVLNWVIKRYEEEQQQKAKGGSSVYGNDEQGTRFIPKPITQADLPGFHNALDRYDDEGHRIDCDGE